MLTRCGGCRTHTAMAAWLTPPSPLSPLPPKHQPPSHQPALKLNRRGRAVRHCAGRCCGCVLADSRSLLVRRPSGRARACQMPYAALQGGFFFLVQTKMSWRSLLTSQYSR